MPACGCTSYWGQKRPIINLPYIWGRYYYVIYCSSFACKGHNMASGTAYYGTSHADIYCSPPMPWSNTSNASNASDTHGANTILSILTNRQRDAASSTQFNPHCRTACLKLIGAMLSLLRDYQLETGENKCQWLLTTISDQRVMIITDKNENHTTISVFDAIVYIEERWGEDLVIRCHVLRGKLSHLISSDDNNRIGAATLTSFLVSPRSFILNAFHLLFF